MSLAYEQHLQRKARLAAWNARAVPDMGINMRDGRPVRIEPPAPAPAPAPAPEPEPEPQPDPVIVDIPMEGLLRNVRQGPMSTKLILRIVAAFFGVTVPEMTGQCRRKRLCWARQVAMYLAKVQTKHSFPRIAKHFGGRDHTTILHAVRKVEAAMQADEGVRAQVDELLSIIRA